MQYTHASPGSNALSLVILCPCLFILELSSSVCEYMCFFCPSPRAKGGHPSRCLGLLLFRFFIGRLTGIAASSDGALFRTLPLPRGVLTKHDTKKPFVRSSGEQRIRDGAEAVQPENERFSACSKRRFEHTFTCFVFKASPRPCREDIGSRG
jgi:hypothetical protein